MVSTTTSISTSTSSKCAILHPNETPRQHGVKGVYYGGEWLDIEDCQGVFDINSSHCSAVAECQKKDRCPRSQSRIRSNRVPADGVYDVLIIGAGCIGAAIARELSRYDLAVLWVECADDVSQGATKGNSGIVHSGYDDEPGTNRAKYCWKGNQMFRQLDRDLRFGYQRNGSLVLAFHEAEVDILHQLLERGRSNGVQRLRIVDREELLSMEPHVNPNVVAALYSPDAGNVIPYEYAIALAENAVDNGVELRIRREVTNIIQQPHNTDTAPYFTVTLRHWEPHDYVNALSSVPSSNPTRDALILLFITVISVCALTILERVDDMKIVVLLLVTFPLSFLLLRLTNKTKQEQHMSSARSTTNIAQMAKQVEPDAVGTDGYKVQVEDMLKGGSGWMTSVNGVTVKTEIIKTTYIVNCAGGYADVISRMIGDDSFQIKPRLGDYLLLNRNQVSI